MTIRSFDKPSESDVLDAHKRDILFSTNCHGIAQVTSFDPSKQTVAGKMVYNRVLSRRQTNGTYKDEEVPYTLLVDCPVYIPRGGVSSLTLPIAAGDYFLVCFNDRDFDNWWATGSTTAPSTARTHAFTDAIALVGLSHSRAPLEQYDMLRAALNYGNAKIAVGARVLLTTDKADPAKTLGALISELTNELQTLCANLAVLQVTGVTAGGNISGVPVGAAAITAIGTQIAATAVKLQGLLE